VGPTSDVLKTPAHPYTAALISATPTPEPGASRRRIVLAGEPSSAFEPPGGCPFHPRCPAATDKCRNVAPALALHRNDVRVACHYPGTLGPTPSASPA